MTARGDMPPRVSATCGAISYVLAVLNGLALLGFAGGVWHVRSRFAEIYADLLEGRGLPVATQMVLEAPAWSFPLAALVLLALLAVKERIRPGWIPLLLNIVWMVVGVCMVLAFSAIMMLPLITIIQQLGAPAPGAAG